MIVIKLAFLNCVIYCICTIHRSIEKTIVDWATLA